jgi:hypothetical protein
MKRLEIIVEEPAPSDDAILLFPRPFDHWGQIFLSVETNAAGDPAELTAVNSEQRAYAAGAANGAPTTITYHIAERDEPVPPSVWRVQQNHLTQADGSLMVLAREITAHADSVNAKLRALMEYAAGVFSYELIGDLFYEGHENIPALCGTTKGSCIDINAFLLTAALSLGLRGQYIAGYWFPPQKMKTDDMHCWLAFETEGELIFWDLAHHLRWDIKKLAPGFNPAGGHRIAMSRGCEIQFNTENGQVQIGHFSRPVWVLPGARVVEPKIHVGVSE